MDGHTINLILLVLFLAFTAIFVAFEFAIVKVRTSRLDQLIASGNKKAILTKKLSSDLDYYLSACQLGITITSLGLGAFTKPYIKHLLYPVFEWLNVSETMTTVASYIIALAIVSYLHVVIGEMAPKTLAIEFSERIALLLSPPLYWFGKVMSPFIKALNVASRLVLRMLGIQPAGHEQAYSEEELKMIMVQSYQGGEIDQTELNYLENVFAFDERVAKDIMVPRTELITIDITMNSDEIVAILDEHNYTRYPVIENGDKDKIIGIINAKKLLNHIVTKREDKLENYVRSVPFILEVTSIQDALLKMQQEKVHMTVVIDEYGGTAGVLTMEDILEELVGEIRDEFDDDEVDEIQEISPYEFLLSGRVLLDDLEEQFGLTFDDREDIDTIGGWIQHKHVEIAAVGVTVKTVEASWTVEEMDHHQIRQVRFMHTPQKQAVEEEDN